MTDHQQDEPAAATIAQPPADLPPGETPSRKAPRNTVADTWHWLWKDTLGRLVPFAGAAVLYAVLSGRGAAALGITSADLGLNLAMGIGLGVPMLAAAVAFRMWDAPGYRLPTAPDQALQSAFYFVLNAPVEELFWRGTVQTLAIAGAAALLRGSGLATWIGWGLTTAVFGAYHRLGNWRWRSIAGVTVAGAAFGALYLAAPGGSIVPVVIVHGFATAGFLSWGDVALDLRRRCRERTANASAGATRKRSRR